MRQTRNPSGTPLFVPADPVRAARVREIAQARAAEPGPLLEVLHDVHNEFGHLDGDDVPAIAEVLNLSRADVHGVISFYTDFRTSAPPTHHLALCRGEACQSLGAEALYAACSSRYADAPDVEVSEVFCFGNCALGPSGTVDGTLHGRLTPERVAVLTKEWQR